MSPVTRFKSEPTVFTYDEGRKTYEPHNYADKYVEDYIDMRQAIAGSDNIYAVNTIMTVGADKVIETARMLGIQSGMRPVPSLALGTFPVSPFEMASAYGAFSNEGERIEPTAILRIEDRKGQVLYEAKPRREQVISPAEAYVMTNLLQSVFDKGGTAHRVASVLKRPVAAERNNLYGCMAGRLYARSSRLPYGLVTTRTACSLKRRRIEQRRSSRISWKTRWQPFLQAVPRT